MSTLDACAVAVARLLFGFTSMLVLERLWRRVTVSVVYSAFGVVTEVRCYTAVIVGGARERMPSTTKRLYIDLRCPELRPVIVV